MDANTIIAIGTILTAVGSLLLGLNTNRTSARKSEFDALRDTVACLSTENERLRKHQDETDRELEAVRNENAELRKDNERMRKRQTELEAENTDLRGELVALRAQMNAKAS